MAADPLEPLLALIRAEVLAAPEGVRALAQALRERARVVIAERDQQLAALERENAWRAETTASLEAESRWRQEAMATLEAGLASREAKIAWLEQTLADLARERDHERASVASLERELATLSAHASELATLSAQSSAAFADLSREAESLRAEWKTAAAAHQRLLEHHRELLARLADGLEPLAPALPWRHREVSRRLAELIVALRREQA